MTSHITELTSFLDNIIREFKKGREDWLNEGTSSFCPCDTFLSTSVTSSANDDVKL